jgi:hypothetical protein
VSRRPRTLLLRGTVNRIDPAVGPRREDVPGSDRRSTVPCNGILRARSRIAIRSSFGVAGVRKPPRRAVHRFDRTLVECAVACFATRSIGHRPRRWGFRRRLLPLLMSFRHSGTCLTSDLNQVCFLLCPGTEGRIGSNEHRLPRSFAGALDSGWVRRNRSAQRLCRDAKTGCEGSDRGTQ